MTGDRITIRKVTSKNPKSVSKLSNFNCRFYFIIWNHITEEHAFYTFIHLENTYIVQKVTKKRNSTVRFGKGWDHLDLVHFLQVLDNLVLGHQNIIQFGSPAVSAWGPSPKLFCASDVCPDLPTWRVSSSFTSKGVFPSYCMCTWKCIPS